MPAVTPTPSVSIRVCYRPDGLKVKAMEGGTANDFHTCYLKRDLVYLILPPAEPRSLRFDGDGRISCKWNVRVVNGKDEDITLVEIQKQVSFLNTEGAAQLLAFMEIERVELVSCIAEVDPTPAGGIVLTRDAVEQVYVREANLIKENAALRAKHSALQEEERLLTQENNRLRALRAAR